MTSSTQRHASLFEERNLFVTALLGLFAKGRRVEEWLLREAHASEPVELPLPHGAPFLDFLMGLISAQRSMQRLLGDFATEAGAPDPTEEATQPPCLRSLLK